MTLRWQIRGILSPIAPAFCVAALLVTALAPQAAPAQTQNPGYVRNTLPETVVFDDGTFGLRIVGGAPAPRGAWPSMITLFNRNFAGGRLPMCGGTLIDSRWVLTAAHCVFGREARDFFIREATNNAIGGGRAIDVVSVTWHEQYAPRPPLNDIALLQLAVPADSPRQMLLRSSLRGEFLQERNVGTVIGYGLIKPQPAEKPQNFDFGPASEQLLQVDIPLVSRERCARAYDASAITEATVCAGTDDGGKDSCQGDSGGPLFVRDRFKQPVQAGVVSWGSGCAQPGKYGIYTSIGYFEDWIRKHVPNASFATPPQSAPAPGTTDQQLENYVGDAGAAQPGALAQVNVDVLAGERIRIGNAISVRVTSSVPGSLFVFNEDMTTRRSFQLFPNQRSGGNLPGQAPAAVGAGRPLTIPGPTDGFVLRVRPPVGKNRMIAIVVPPNVRISDLAQKNANMQPIADLDGLLDEIAQRESTTRDIGVEAAIPRNRAIGIREYEITQ